MRQESIRRLVSLGLLLALAVAFGATSERFLTPANAFTLLREASVPGMVAVGMTFVIITAGIDLSVGAVLAFVAMVAANLLYYTSMPVPLIVAAGLLVGCGAGLLNGLLVTRLRLPDFVATLAMQGVFRGLTLVAAIRTSGTISNKLITNEDFLVLGGQNHGLYLVTLVFLGTALAGQVLLKSTRLGTYTYAVGAARKSADLSGIPSDRVKLVAYGISGLCSALAGLFLAARLETAIPEMGMGLEFDVIAAVVIGGCAFSGGRGDVAGSVIGALFIAILTNGIYKYNLPTAFHVIVKGSVILVMIAFDSVYRRYMEGRLRESGRIARRAALAQVRGAQP
jgi:ribose transport system permease protein